jgi:hypothetical protein
MLLTSSKPPLTWKPECKEKVEFLLKRFPEKEWSGILFYEITGSIKEVKKLKILVHDLYLMDIGNGGASKFEWDEDFVGYMMDNPNLKYLRKGDIHSHHQMGAYFSSTDWKDVGANSELFDWLLSIVVSSKGEWVGKIIARASQEVRLEMIDEQRKPFYIKTKVDENNILISYDLDMGYKPIQFNISETFMKRINELENIKIKEREKQTASWDAQRKKNIEEWQKTQRQTYPGQYIPVRTDNKETNENEVQANIFKQVWEGNVIEFMKRLLSLNVSIPVNSKYTIEKLIKIREQEAIKKKGRSTEEQTNDIVNYFEEAYLIYFVTPEDKANYPHEDVISFILDKLDNFAPKYEFANELFMAIDIHEFFEPDEDNELNQQIIPT